MSLNLQAIWASTSMWMFSLLSQNIPTPAIIGLSKPFFELPSADFFQNQLVRKIISRIRFVGPDLGQSCL